MTPGSEGEMKKALDSGCYVVDENQVIWSHPNPTFMQYDYYKLKCERSS